MTGLIMAGQLFLALGLLVFIHELGHFLAARAFGIKVEKFYIFFDFNGIKLFSKKIGDTEYGIGWFPLGGYVKIAGMVDESMDTEQLKSEPQPWEFRTKPAWQRLIVMLAGVTMNVILGVLIYTFVLKHYAKEYVDPVSVTDGIYAYKTAEEVGFKNGDRILTINGKVPQRDADIFAQQVFMGGTVGINRNGKDTLIQIPSTFIKTHKKIKDSFYAFHNYKFSVDSVPPLDPITNKPSVASKIGMQKGDSIIAINGEKVNVFGDVRALLLKYDSSRVDITLKRKDSLLTVKTDTVRHAMLGFIPSPRKMPYPTTDYTWGSAFKYGAIDGFSAIADQVKAFGMIFTGKLALRESFQSPIGIAQAFGAVWDWARFWYLTGLISFVLAFMNILPIPALDGGHVVFIIVEVIQGKPVSEKTMENAQKVGIAILLTLMVFTLGNDLIKVIFKF